MSNFGRCSVTLGAFFVALLFARMSAATTINISPSDNWTKIEAAQAGDVVLIAPGTYKFLVYLQNSGTPSSPITIQAEDPSNRPVWDLSGMDVQNAPGSYTAPDRGRGCWQIVGSYYQISGIVFQNCTSAADGHDSSGIRYYQETTGQGSLGLLISNCLFQHNDEGLTGGALGTDMTVEFSEFYGNGVPPNIGSHNIYIYGGAYTMRYSYVHDSASGLNLHCRAITSTIEYNWFSRGYITEMQFDSPDEPPAQPFAKTVLLQGNVIVQAAHPGNSSKVVTLYNDESENMTIRLTANANTFIGNGGTSAFVQLADGNPTDSAVLTNNILSGTTVVETGGTVSGANNWLATGTDATGLTGSVLGSSPGFVSGASYRLAAGSSCIGHADVAVNAPTEEYYFDEAMPLLYRNRATAHDIGAFESTTTGPGVGEADGGPFADAGQAPDAKELGDVAAPMDAGVVDSDGGVDAPVGMEASVQGDSGGGTDSSVGSDASVQEEAGGGTDGSMTPMADGSDDATMGGSGRDAGALSADASSAAGAKGGAKSGCGCSTVREGGLRSSLTLSVAVLALALARRRVRTKRHGVARGSALLGA